MNLEPTEAQRKAMAEATEAWNWYSCGPERRLDMVDDMIAAANSIPEGAPVGTVKQRPDGTFVAVRCGDVSPYPASWVYVRVMPGACEEPYGDDADSWPSYGEITPEPEGCGIGLDGECEGKCRKGYAPVGTIARRPDGEWVAARRVEDEWSYIYVGAFGKPGVEGEWPEADSADYWPQIRPKEWPDSTRGSRELPIGTIVERPDHQARAWREDGYWSFWKPYWSDEDDPCIADDVDSWPVIYDPRDHPSREELQEYFHKDLAEHCQADDPDEYPDEYYEGDKPRLERLMREPSVFDAVLLRDAATRLAESSTEEKDNYHLVNDLLDAAKRLDPTAQQEPELRERFPEQASAYVADPELAEVDDEPLPSGSLITPKPEILGDPS
ncbi:hypothetical protein [Mycobacteroides abscessus]|uniref:hypothetical protein n=1 Tax=Mycobacteroides abscessus TaxID=36809 RepID=UPI00232C11F8|nr:hypothetical protein [Mycobacteroides abscessus]MDB2222325.1 hypothetical protein [Mycobacteroides abscessus subsp. abscessus]